MRILFVSNLYPPYDLGGWEQNCQEIVERLRVRGHHCRVITSRFGTRGQPEFEEDVTRALHLQAHVHHYRPLDFFLLRSWRQRDNHRALSSALAAFRPDTVFVWGMWNLSRRIPYWAERWPSVRVAYAVADYWLIEPGVHEAYWQRPARRWWVRALVSPARASALYILKRARAKHSLALEHVACVSDHVRHRLANAGALPYGARVIHNGIDPQPFLNASRGRLSSGNGLRLVYAGGLSANKGVHTAVEALGLLRQQGQSDGIHLVLVGGGHPDYERQLRRRVNELGLGNCVRFYGRAPRDQIPAILADHDVFLFTSVYEEPLARSVMEAMVAGLSVIGTPVGGQREMLEDSVNALLFPPDDAGGLARCILRLQDDPALRARLAEAGQRTVMEHFTLERMVSEIEAWLAGIVA